MHYTDVLDKGLCDNPPARWKNDRDANEMPGVERMRDEYKFNLMRAGVGIDINIGISSGGFDPTNIEGLVLWLDANDSSTITEAGAGVSAWTDKSGNGVDFAQTTDGARPAYSTGAQNGRNIVAFDVSNTEWMTAGDKELHDNTNGFSIFAAVNANASGDAIISKRDDTAGRQWYLKTEECRTDEETGSSTAGNEVSYSDTSFIGSTWAVIGMVWVPTVSTTAFLNGSSNGTAATPANDIGAAATQLLVGARNEGTTDYLDGDIGEVVAYNRAVNATEISQIQAYLSGWL